MIPLSLASFCGPIIIGPWFDKIGRKKMTLITCKFNYNLVGSSGILLFILNFFKSNLIVL